MDRLTERCYVVLVKVFLYCTTIGCKVMILTYCSLLPNNGLGMAGVFTLIHPIEWYLTVRYKWGIHIHNYCCVDRLEPSPKN